MTDPVTRDLNQYLADQEEEESQYALQQEFEKDVKQGIRDGIDDFFNEWEPVEVDSFLDNANNLYIQLDDRWIKLSPELAEQLKFDLSVSLMELDITEWADAEEHQSRLQWEDQ